MKVLITGSRNFHNYKALAAAISEIEVIMSLAWQEPVAATEILHGGAKGADELANIYAKKHGIKCTVIRPDYKKHPGKLAPLMRNTELVAAADCTVAAYGAGRDGKGGTADAARKTKRAGKHLLELRADGSTKHTAPPPEQTTLW